MLVSIQEIWQRVVGQVWWCNFGWFKLNKAEYEAIVAKKDQKFGNIEDGEVITLEVVNLKEIFNKLVDFSVIGMIFSSILEEYASLFPNSFIIKKRERKISALLKNSIT